jgi:hypothetical protein
MKRLGYFRARARDLAARIVELIAGGTACNENYNSVAEKPLGALDLGWLTLILDVIADAAKKAGSKLL